MRSDPRHFLSRVRPRKSTAQARSGFFVRSQTRSTPRTSTPGVFDGGNRCGVLASGRFAWRPLPERRRACGNRTPARKSRASRPAGSMWSLPLNTAPCPGKDRVEVERHHLLERRRPFLHERVSGVGERARHHVAGRDDSLLRQKYDDVAVGVRTSDEPNLNLASAPMQRQVVGQRRGRRRRLESFCSSAYCW